MTSTVSGTRASRDTLLRALTTLGVLGVFLGLLAFMPNYRWEWHRVWGGERGNFMLMGIPVVLGISAASLVLSLVLGIAGGLARLSKNPILNQLAAIYVEIVRGTPLLVQVLVAYFCFAPLVGGLVETLGGPTALVELANNRVVVGTLTLALFTGAYVTEIVRAAVESIDKGQTEAALSQGMTRRQVYRLVIFPQAARRMVPPMAGQFVSLVKDSSLLMIIGVLELTKRASEVRSSTYKDFEVLLPLALMYLVITFPLSRLARRLELRLT